ncbi:uncharacterized protein LOC143896764 [Temnothorax americanus]|uniref:uncharacterized protein LOC143896764 n=1 Tax=Temnothorax americanus TaxID=1964332 RepID=UPI0040697D18
MIIGADYYGSIILEGIKRGSGNEPLAQQTIFGWILSGSIDTGGSPAKGRILHCSTDDELQESLTRFWKQEETISLPGSNLTPDELACEQHFVNTHSRDQKGLKRRFSSDPLYKQRYEESLKDYLTLGHMVAAPISEDSTPAFYLPHHGVIREDRLTTKLRVVFNGSCRTSSGVSLNEILHSGAKLQTDISDVLLWIRTHRFIFSTDIVKMFRQIAVHPDDWALQSILWFNSEGQPAPHRLTTVTFGLTCAPFLALRTVLQLIEDEGARFPKAVPALKKGRYIDDTFGGADTISEAKEIVHQVTQLCMAGGFPLQKWKSNNQEILPPVLDSSNESSSESSSPVEFEPSLVKILGLIWNPETDTFLFSDKSSQRDRVTKRTILSEIAQMYDPLGFISPVMIRSKIILQELWLLKSGWDDSVPSELHDRWISFRLQLTTLQKLSIPRWLGLGSSKRIVELHGFSDASSMAMAAAVFVWVSQGNDEYLVRLKVLDLSDVPVHLWTDSSVTLYWITTHPSRWKDFVRNRVTAIQEMLPQGSWHFIPGKQNPADCASRGLTPEQLINHNLWWNGPSWLSEPSSLWPKAVSKLSPETDLEERPGMVSLTVSSLKPYCIASKELRELASILAKDGTKWIFNPPSAPHFGGKWEAAVKSTKFHLTRVIGDTLLTYEELNTVIIQIEAVLNSRPLCPLSDDPSDYTALTPGHFLIGESLTTIPEPELSSEPETRLNRWQLLRKKIDCFWKRWSVECLQRYLAVSKWYHPSNDIKEGSLVLMTDERYPPSKWPLGRVTKLHPGPDGLTRVVTLRTASSSFKRPIAKLCVLPFNPDENCSPTLSSKAGGNVSKLTPL